MSQQEPPKIEFPCDYTIRVMGESAPDFQQFVVEVMERHAGSIPPSKVGQRESSKGRFASIQVTIVATGEDQLRAIHTELQASGRVKMVI